MAKLNNIELLNQMINEHYVNVVKHPVFDLYIYNYSNKAQIDKVWNAATKQCRGIICDKDMNIVARPFEKFYNYEELVLNGCESEIPDLPFEAYEKLDGSLGILYFGPDDIPYISTRGTFDSPQAQHATNILHTKYADVLDKLDKSKTYLFEIIYPEDMHVVTYHDLDDIFLLAVIDTETGEEYNIDNYKNIFNVVKKYDGVTDYHEIREMFSGENKEGFVIKFSNNYRMKMKFEQYFKLYSIKEGFTDRVIFEHIAANDIDELNEILDMFDEEHKLYFTNIIQKFRNEFMDIVDTCIHEYEDDFESQADAAKYFNTCVYPAVMFMMQKRKEITDVVWGYVSKKYFNKSWNSKTYWNNKKK